MRAAEGNQEPQLHNALAMIYIEMGRDPETYLKNNPYYDSAVVGIILYVSIVWHISWTLFVTS